MAQADMFLVLKDIKGESGDETYKDAIGVLSFSWGVSNASSAATGGGAGVGKANFNDITVTKYVDLSTAALVKQCALGRHIPSGKLIARKSGGDGGPLDYLVIELEKIYVASVQGGGASGGGQVTETVSLSFGKYKIKYQKQADEGGAAGEDDFGYDLIAGTPL